MSNSPTRRHFLAASTSVAAAFSTGAFIRGAELPSSSEKFRAAVIGHTGRGDYGHGMDLIFNDRADCEVVAVADSDDAGRAKAAGRCKAARQYADYREMLAKERPQLVSIGPRHTDQHVEMALAAIGAGAHLFMEKPIASSPAECDAILAAADGAKRKVAVAHQMRMAPRVVRARQMLDEGALGELLQVDAWGKQDARRAGGEDMMVLGTHLFDLMRLFAGDPQWCTARVLQNGKDVTKADARKAGEAIGPVAGDEIFAQFAFANGVNATFTSRAKLSDATGAWGIELTGTKGSLRLLTDIDPDVLVLRPGTWSAAGRSDQWQPLDGKPGVKGNFAEANRRLVDDWIAAIRADREPTCSGRNAAKAVEMVAAVYHAALSGSRVALPLRDRAHPLD